MRPAVTGSLVTFRARFPPFDGTFQLARCPEGHPVIIQAGGSPSGLELAARTADVVFSVVQELDSAKKAYADLKGRMAKYGRSPEQLSVLPGVMPIIGASEAEAKEKLSRLQSWLTPTNALTLVTGRIGYDVSIMRRSRIRPPTWLSTAAVDGPLFGFAMPFTV